MKVYGYVRLSRDEDKNKESLNTQMDYLRSYAKDNNFELVEIIEDDNVSGYSFDRPGLNRLRELIESGQVDVLIAKDLSRIGRHQAQSLIFMEYLTEYGVRLICISDNYDSNIESNDMIVGLKAWYNEIYVKDISKKIKANIRQKQKDGGLVIVPTFGYYKCPNDPKKFEVDIEAAETVRLIFKLFIEGLGVKKIARHLNEQGFKTPGVIKREKYGIDGRQVDTQDHLWYETSVKRILSNDAYMGRLRCGVTKLKGIKGKKVRVPKEEHIVHEDFFPAIITKEEFDLAQLIAQNRLNGNVRAKNNKIHRYAGILKCSECGKGFVARKTTNKTQKIYYTCATYHRYGNEHCSPHRIYEDALNERLLSEVQSLLIDAQTNLELVDKSILNRKKLQLDYEKELDKLVLEISAAKNELKHYSKQFAKGQINEGLFEELSEETNKNLKNLQDRLEEIGERKDISSNMKTHLIKSIDILTTICKNREITNKDIQLMVDKIVVSDTQVKSKQNRIDVDVKVEWRTPFKYHKVTLS